MFWYLFQCKYSISDYTYECAVLEEAFLSTVTKGNTKERLQSIKFKVLRFIISHTCRKTYFKILTKKFTIYNDMEACWYFLLQYFSSSVFFLYIIFCLEYFNVECRILMVSLGLEHRHSKCIFLFLTCKKPCRLRKSFTTCLVHSLYPSVQVSEVF